MGGVTEVSSKDLVERVLEGDRAASAELYDVLAPGLRRFLVGLRLPLAAQDLDDAVQEVFLRLFRGLSRFDRKRSLKAYAMGIARYVALDLIHRAPREAPGDVSLALGKQRPSREAARRERWRHQASQRLSVHRSLTRVYWRVPSAGAV